MADTEAVRLALFDLDGTLADFDGAMQRDMRTLQAPGEEPFVRADDKGPSYLQERMRLIRKQPGWWRNLDRFQLGWDILTEALDIGFDVMVLTKGPYNTTSAWTEKVEWCRANLPYRTKVTITEDKSAVYGRVLVDDWPEYVEPWLAKRPRGIAIMPAQRWNKDYYETGSEKFKERVVRYDGSNKDLVRAVLKKAYDR